MVIQVNVYAAKDCSAFSYNTGYVAIAETMESCWAYAETIDGTIEQFKKQYGGFLTMQFANNEKIVFDYHVKLS